MNRRHVILIAACGLTVLVLLTWRGATRQASPMRVATPESKLPTTREVELEKTPTEPVSRVTATEIARMPSWPVAELPIPPPPESPPVTRPPGLTGVSSSGMVFYWDSDKRYQARALAEKEFGVRIVSYHAVSPGHPEKQSEVITARFWPTTMTKLSEGNLAIAGVDPENNHTLVEIWHSDPPADAADDPRDWRPAQLRSVERIHDERAVGRRIVEAMMPFWGRLEEALLVRFRGNDDVYSLDMRRVCRLVASPDEVSGAIHAPFLRLARPDRSRELVHGGYVYMFHKDAGRNPSADSIFFLEDANKDGLIDGVSSMSDQQYLDRGYGNVEAWIEH